MHISGAHDAFNAGTVLVQHSMSTFQHAPGHALKVVIPTKCLINHAHGAAHAPECAADALALVLLLLLVHAAFTTLFNGRRGSALAGLEWFAALTA
jgi:hypothetical protein